MNATATKRTTMYTTCSTMIVVYNSRALQCSSSTSILKREKSLQFYCEAEFGSLL